MSRSPRKQKIDEMVQAALNAINDVADNDTSYDEAMRACFVLTKRAIKTALAAHPEYRHQVQDMAEILLLECADRENPI